MPLQPSSILPSPDAHALPLRGTARFVYTAVLYLADEEADITARRGGETALVDEMHRDERSGECVLAKGVVVEPRRGRLLIFTGSGENYHSPLPVVQGRRTTYHAWFKCADRVRV